MNTKLLKQKILDLAIRGKLTQQLKSDGTAADLLKEICDRTQEKTSLRAKRGNPSPQTIIPLDKSEAPFEIPENWEWVRLGDLCNASSGKTPSTSQKEFWNGNVLWVTSKDVKQKYIDSTQICLSDLGASSMQLYPPKTMIIVGRSGILRHSLPVAILKKSATVNQDLKALVFKDDRIVEFVYAVIKGMEQHLLHEYKKAGTTVDNLNFDLFLTAPISLPPLAEQQRIVEKIQEAFAEIDSIENNKELLKTHIRQARQKILDLAIHGKLVPQNKADEPARVLLERITRDNPHYEKLTDIPFEIPESWEWVKLGDVCKPIKRGKSPKYIEQSNILVFAQKCNQKDGPVSLEKALYLDESTLNKYPKEEFLQKGDVIINSTGTGTLGRVGLFNVDLPQGIKGIVPDSHVTTIRSSVVNSNYLYSYLKNKQSYLEKNGEGSTNQKELKPHTIYDLEFPLPPLAEQKRIVNKIEEIFASLDAISRHLD